MKKKRIIFIVLMTFAMTFLLAACTDKGEEKTETMNGSIDEKTVNKVVMYYPGDNETIFTEQQDIHAFVDLIQSLELEKTTPNEKDGFLCTIDIYYEDDTKSSIVVASKDITIDGQNYKPKRDYCDDFRELYEDIAAEDKK